MAEKKYCSSKFKCGEDLDAALEAALNAGVCAGRAEEARKAVEDMKVAAFGLSEGSSPTVEKAEEGGVIKLTFGLPPGEKGDPGDPGVTPHIGANGNWFIGDTDTGIPASGGGGSGDIPEDVEERLTELEQQMADLQYEAISIGSFSHNAGTKEMGSTLTNVTLSWQTNKTPTTLKLDGVTLDAKATSTTLSGLQISGNKTWTLKATDERGAEANKSTTVSFQNGIYYGTKAAPAAIDSAFITGLGKKELSGTKNRTVSVAGGDGLYFWYAYPKRLGTSLFNIGGFDYEYGLETVSFTNAYGYKEEYYVYRSGQYAPASLSVTVKNGG